MEQQNGIPNRQQKQIVNSDQLYKILSPTHDRNFFSPSEIKKIQGLRKQSQSNLLSPEIKTFTSGQIIVKGVSQKRDLPIQVREVPTSVVEQPLLQQLKGSQLKLTVKRDSIKEPASSSRLKQTNLNETEQTPTANSSGLPDIMKPYSAVSIADQTENSQQNHKYRFRRRHQSVQQNQSEILTPKVGAASVQTNVKETEASTPVPDVNQNEKKQIKKGPSKLQIFQALLEESTQQLQMEMIHKQILLKDQQTPKIQIQEQQSPPIKLKLPSSDQVNENNSNPDESPINATPLPKKKTKKQTKTPTAAQTGPLMEPPPKIDQKQIIINTSRSEYPLIDQVATEVMGWQVSKQEDMSKADFDLWWSDIGIDLFTLQQLKCYQKVNHFPAIYQIARKTFLARNLKRLQRIYPNEYNFFPRTWILPNEINDLKFCQEQASKAQQPQNTTAQWSKHTRKQSVPQISYKNSIGFTMICKPDHESQGRGIFLTHEIESIPLTEPTVVQEYLNTPYLIDGLKFDMRIYVLVMSCDPLTIFLHKEGLVRFATQPYQPLNINSDKEIMKNMFVHLTNYALNKANSEFKQASSIDDEQGHKRSITSLLKRLRADTKDVDSMLSEIKDIIIKTMLSIQRELAHSYRMNQPADLEYRMCFELLGFDIILDSNLKPMLLEVNHAPSFATDSPLDYEIKKALFVDMFGMLGLTLERKKDKLMSNYEEKLSRMLEKKTLKEKSKIKQQNLREALQAQEKLEEQKCGGFEKIFPLDLNGITQNYQKVLNSVDSTPEQKTISQHAYQTQMSRYNTYNDVLLTVNNEEHEKAVRQQLKQQEVRAKQEQALKDEELKKKLKKKKLKQDLEAYQKLMRQQNESITISRNNEASTSKQSLSLDDQDFQKQMMQSTYQSVGFSKNESAKHIERRRSISESDQVHLQTHSITLQKKQIKSQSDPKKITSNFQAVRIIQPVSETIKPSQQASDYTSIVEGRVELQNEKQKISQNQYKSKDQSEQLSQWTLPTISVSQHSSSSQPYSDQLIKVQMQNERFQVHAGFGITNSPSFRTPKLAIIGSSPAKSQIPRNQSVQRQDYIKQILENLNNQSAVINRMVDQRPLSRNSPKKNNQVLTSLPVLNIGMQFPNSTQDQERVRRKTDQSKLQIRSPDLSSLDIQKTVQNNLSGNEFIERHFDMRQSPQRQQLGQLVETFSTFQKHPSNIEGVNFNLAISDGSQKPQKRKNRGVEFEGELMNNLNFIHQGPANLNLTNCQVTIINNNHYYELPSSQNRLQKVQNLAEKITNLKN